MGATLEGIKSGFISGIIYGILDSVLVVLLVLFFREQVMNSLSVFVTRYPDTFPGASVQGLYNLSLSLIPLVSVTGGVLLGMVFGVLFANIHERIPGRSGPTKGVLFGLSLWVVLNVLIGLLDLSAFGWYYYLSSIAGGLISTMGFGYSLGTLYGYFSRSERNAGDTD